jgi:hypothetical protein
LSRCVSNLGSTLGTGIAGTILVSSLGKTSYAAAMIVLAAIALIGVGATMRLPAHTGSTIVAQGEERNA